MGDNDDMNRKVVDEFRANAGIVGGYFTGATLLILHTVGAKSGRPLETPLVYRPDGDSWIIFASAGGAPRHPAWFHNLKANRDVKIEVGSETIAAIATELTGAERDTVYAAQATDMPNFAEYQAATDRLIPVVRLVRS